MSIIYYAVFFRKFMGNWGERTLSFNLSIYEVETKIFGFDIFALYLSVEPIQQYIILDKAYITMRSCGYRRYFIMKNWWSIFLNSVNKLFILKNKTFAYFDVTSHGWEYFFGTLDISIL